MHTKKALQGGGMKNSCSKNKKLTDSITKEMASAGFNLLLIREYAHAGGNILGMKIRICNIVIQRDTKKKR